MAKKFDISKMNLGAGLFNESTRNLIENQLDIVYIPYEKLRVDERNQYSAVNIPELSESIEDIGLQQPLNVILAEDGMYDILGGQRRYLAIGSLLKSGNTRYKNVPCTIINPKSIDLPLDDDTKSLYIIASTNEYRDMTDGDRLLRIQQLSKVYDQLAKNGNGESIGKRRRDFIAESINMSPRTVQDYLSIDKKLDHDLKDAVIKGDLDLRTGVKISNLPVEQQKEISSEYNQASESGVPVDLASKMDDIDKSNSSTNSQKKTVIKKEHLESLFCENQDILKTIDLFDSEIILSVKSKEKFEKLGSDFAKIQSKLLVLLKKEIKKNSKNHK